MRGGNTREGKPPHRTSRRADLQRLLGDAGEVLPRVMHGSPEFPAQGWYAEIDGERVFLGDYSLLAGTKIAQLLAGRNGKTPHAA